MADENNVYYDKYGRQHNRRRSQSSYRHRSHKHRDWKKILIIVAVVVCVCVIAGVAGCAALDSYGKASLYARSKAGTPTLDTVETEEQASAPEEVEEWEAGWVRYKGDVYAYNEDILPILFMGIDDNNPVKEAEDSVHGGQADSLFLLIMNPHTKQISLLSINRNTMAEIDVYEPDGTYVGKQVRQICLAHGFGNGLAQSCERQVSAVSELLYDLPIGAYVSLNMGAIPTINDAIGGVTLTAIEDVPYQQYAFVTSGKNPIVGTIKKGEEVTLDAAKAYAYTRWRKTDEDFSADARLERQKQYLREFMKTMKPVLKSNPSKAISLYNAVSPYMVTNIDITELSYLVGQIGDYSLNIDEVYSLAGESVTTERYEEFHVDEDALYDLMIKLFYEKVER